MEEENNTFEKQEEVGIVREFIQFLAENKLWWMMPIFLVLSLLMGIIVVTGNAGALAPFIYTLF
jgi:hypothetical protein